MRALFDRDSALYFKPGDWHRLAPWLLRFRTYCNEADHAHGTAAIARLGQGVFDLVEEMRADGVEFELHKQGMVYAAQNADDARAELRKLAPMREYGYELPDDVITNSELHELEPALSPKVTAGFLVHQHWHVRPDSLTAGLADALRRDGVEITEGADPGAVSLRSAVGQLMGAVAQSAHAASAEQQQRIVDIVNNARREIYHLLGESD